MTKKGGDGKGGDGIAGLFELPSRNQKSHTMINC